jgi:hypothetical protein
MRYSGSSLISCSCPTNVSPVCWRGGAARSWTRRAKGPVKQRPASRLASYRITPSASAASRAFGSSLLPKCARTPRLCQNLVSGRRVRAFRVDSAAWGQSHRAAGSRPYRAGRWNRRGRPTGPVRSSRRTRRGRAGNSAEPSGADAVVRTGDPGRGAGPGTRPPANAVGRASRPGFARSSAPGWHRRCPLGGDRGLSARIRGRR